MFLGKPPAFPCTANPTLTISPPYHYSHSLPRAYETAVARDKGSPSAPLQGCTAPGTPLSQALGSPGSPEPSPGCPCQGLQAYPLPQPTLHLPRPAQSTRGRVSRQKWAPAPQPVTGRSTVPQPVTGGPYPPQPATSGPQPYSQVQTGLGPSEMRR